MTNESSMLERMARTIFARLWTERPSEVEPSYERDPEPYLAAARDVLRELRTPTVAMLVATLPATEGASDPEAERLAAQTCFVLEAGTTTGAEVNEEGRYSAREIIRDWRSMIDAAGSTT